MSVNGLANLFLKKGAFYGQKISVADDFDSCP